MKYQLPCLVLALLAGVERPTEFNREHVVSLELTRHAYRGGGETHLQGFEAQLQVPKFSVPHGSPKLLRVELQVEQTTHWTWGFESADPDFASWSLFSEVSDLFCLDTELIGVSALGNVWTRHDPADGLVDFDGPSGGHGDGPSGFQVWTQTLTEDLDSWIGSGVRDLDVLVRSQFSHDSSAAAWIYGAHFWTGARVTVRYVW